MELPSEAKGSIIDRIDIEDRDNLADIAWFIKGARFATEHDFPLTEDHINSLRKFMDLVKDAYK
jgi:hypothetical protein